MRKLVFICMYLSLTIPCAATTIYVSASAAGANNGSTWTDAYIDLQHALADAQYDDDIWVTEGTYYPDPNGLADPREASFQMINGVGIYGGFPTGGSDFVNRDPNQYETILSGNIGIADDSSDNCYHVFYHPDGYALDPNAIIDSFTITAGNANSSGDHDSGGGMYNYNSSPTVTGCTFTDNWANGGGGGMINSESNPTVINCTFSGNGAGIGGGMYNTASNPIVTNCTFFGNGAGFGGGMFNSTLSDPTVTNCTFTDNSADNRGGGMVNNSLSSMTVTNCILWNNTAPTYKEIYNVSSTPMFSYCDIEGSGGSGAGWSTIIGSDGGGNIDVDPLFVDAPNGDLHLQKISPCINKGNNSAPSLPATDFEGDPRIIHGIVDIGADESVDFMYQLNLTIQPFARSATVTLDPVGGMYPPGTEVTVTVDAEEGYIFDQFTGDLTGSNNPVIITMDYHKYITAHLTINSDIIYVDAGATGLNNGASWTDALYDLQEALEVEVIGQDIWVAEGTYKPSVEVGGSGSRYQTFQMVNGVAIYGGFPTGGDTFVNRDHNQYETILSGDLLGNDNPNTPVDDLLNDPNRDDNCYQVFYHPDGYALDPNTVVDGFTVTGGNANSSSLEYKTYGGGIYNQGNNSPTIINCTFIGNSAGNGGGIYNSFGSTPTVINCTFTGNLAGSGGGISNHKSGILTITGCTFTDNVALWDGGGIYNIGDSPIVTGCTFTGNSAVNQGGGMHNYNGSSPTVTGCVFTGNSADNGGGGIYNNLGSNPTVTNCIFWGNNASLGGNEIALINSSTIDMDYCDVQGGLAGIYNIGGNINWGAGNIDTDPLFADPNNDDFHLKSEGWRWDNDANNWTWDDVTSRCIDAGKPGSLPADEPMTLDVDPLNRWGQNLRINMGAYGGTAEASMPPYDWALLADLTNDGIVNLADFANQGQDWQNTAPEQPGDLNRDGTVDFSDVLLTIKDWLNTTSWY